VLNWMVSRLKPGCVLAIEDCDFSGHFCYPPSQEFARYVDLAGLAMRGRGGDPELGLKLPSLFVGAGLQLGGIEVAHPADVVGDAKLLNALTTENFAHSLVADNLASATEVKHLIATLKSAVEDPGIFASITRRIHVWGRRFDYSLGAGSFRARQCPTEAMSAPPALKRTVPLIQACQSILRPART
jgi:hypothetical protein